MPASADVVAGSRDAQRMELVGDARVSTREGSQLPDRRLGALRGAGHADGRLKAPGLELLAAAQDGPE